MERNVIKSAKKLLAARAVYNKDYKNYENFAKYYNGRHTGPWAQNLPKNMPFNQFSKIHMKMSNRLQRLQNKVESHHESLEILERTLFMKLRRLGYNINASNLGSLIKNLERIANMKRAPFRREITGRR